MKYGLGEMVAIGYKVGVVTNYDPKDKKYQVEWLGGKNRLELFSGESIGEMRENFNLLRNLLKLSGYSNGI